MGRGAGGGAGFGFASDAKWSGTIKDIESLKNIQDAGLYSATKSAISRFYGILGLKQRNVKLADFGGNSAYGVHVTRSGQSEAVYLNKAYFKTGTVKSISASISGNYGERFLTKTNKPVAHALTHELAHSVWNEHMTGSRHIVAGKAISGLFRKWLSDRGKRGYGRYARTNVSEFFAETITKGIHGKQDKYTEGLKSIVKTYKL